MRDAQLTLNASGEGERKNLKKLGRSKKGESRPGCQSGVVCCHTRSDCDILYAATRPTGNPQEYPGIVGVLMNGLHTTWRVLETGCGFYLRSQSYRKYFVGLCGILVGSGPQLDLICLRFDSRKVYLSGPLATLSYVYARLCVYRPPRGVPSRVVSPPQ
jgi:hypothetical protein